MFTWAQTVSDRWALQAFSTTATVGQYAVLFQVGYYPVAIGAGMLVQLATPVLFDRAGDASSPERLRHSRQLNDKLVLVSFVITICATVAAIIGHRWIFRLVAAPAYRAVAPMLPWLVLSAGLFSSAQAASLGPMSADRTERLLTPKVFSAMFGIGLNVLGARLFGIPGVVFAGLAFSVMYFLWSLYLLRTTYLPEPAAC
jgi:O-antigen/teichoic acid export membrane protein